MVQVSKKVVSGPCEVLEMLGDDLLVWSSGSTGKDEELSAVPWFVPLLLPVFFKRIGNTNHRDQPQRSKPPL